MKFVRENVRMKVEDIVIHHREDSMESDRSATGFHDNRKNLAEEIGSNKF